MFCSFSSSSSSAPAMLLLDPAIAVVVGKSVTGALRLPACSRTLSILATSSSTLAMMPVAISRGVPEFAMKNIDGTGTTLSEGQKHGLG